MEKTVNYEQEKSIEPSGVANEGWSLPFYRYSLILKMFYRGFLKFPGLF